ncbi:MAG TPA: hypothetical protein VLA21_07235 [Candidatus Limnocylindria bacterium]|nr:hypothetical protein [Candidatus Limnocylindria bacterium]
MRANAFLRALGLLLACALCAAPPAALAGELLQMTGFDCDAGAHPPVGAPITWTITASGGTGAKEYRFAVYWGPDVYSDTHTGSMLFASRPFGPGRSFSFTPDREGVYFVHGTVRDAAGTTRTSINRNAVFPPPSVLSVGADRTLGTVGEPIRWTATFEGGTGYRRTAQFVVQRDREYASASEPAEVAFGDREASYVSAPDAAGSFRVVFYINAHTELDVMTSGSVTVAEPLRVASFEADQRRVMPGDTVTWTAQATGGHGESYRFWLFRDGELVDERAAGPSAAFSAVLDREGAYTACCVVSDALGSVPVAAADVHAGYYMLMRAVMLGILPNRDRAPVGTRITWIVLVAGGTGDRTYGYTLLKDGAAVGSFSGAENAFTYVLDAPGHYRLRVRVEDGSGTAENEGGDVYISPQYQGMYGGPAVYRFLTRPPQTPAPTPRPTGEKRTATPAPTPRPTSKPTPTPPPTPRMTRTPVPTFTPAPPVTPLPPLPPRTTRPPALTTPTLRPLTAAAKADTAYGEVRRPFTVKASATGGTGKYEYAFRVYLEGAAIGAATPYGDSDTFAYTPLKPGNYKVLALVRDGMSKASAWTGTIHIK